MQKLVVQSADYDNNFQHNDNIRSADHNHERAACDNFGPDDHCAACDQHHDNAVNDIDDFDNVDHNYVAFDHLDIDEHHNSGGAQH